MLVDVRTRFCDLCIILSFVCWISGCRQESVDELDYALGSVGDFIFSEKIRFYKDDRLIHAFSGGAESGNLISYKLGEYFWSRGIHRSLYNVPVPEKIVVQWVSFADKERYRVSLTLPGNLEELMAKEYVCDYRTKGKKTKLHRLGIGVAPGGYAEVYIFSLCRVEYLVVSRALGKSYTTKYDVEVASLAKQYENSWKTFEKNFPNLYQNHPLPDPKDWQKLVKPRYDLYDRYE